MADQKTVKAKAPRNAVAYVKGRLDNGNLKIVVEMEVAEKGVPSSTGASRVHGSFAVREILWKLPNGKLTTVKGLDGRNLRLSGNCLDVVPGAAVADTGSIPEVE